LLVGSTGDRRHALACRPDQEDAFLALGERLDRHWPAANRAAGGLGGERAMLFVALMLADELGTAESRPPEPGSASVQMLEKLADRIEGLADALERTPAAS